jgi:hypothetical protein
LEKSQFTLSPQKQNCINTVSTHLYQQLYQQLFLTTVSVDTAKKGSCINSCINQYQPVSTVCCFGAPGGAKNSKNPVLVGLGLDCGRARKG